MNQTTLRPILQAISIVLLTAFFLTGARGEITITYFGASVSMAVVLTAFGTGGVLWVLRRRKGNVG